MTRSPGVLVFGSINVDFVAQAPHIPRPGETVLATNGARHFGGKGANQAVAAARARRHSGTKVLMAGRVGGDPLGVDCRDNLSRNGVDTSLVGEDQAMTGHALIVVDDRGENAITVIPGANRAARADQVGDAVLSAISHLAMQLEVPIAEVAALGGRARALGVLVVNNFAPMPADLDRANLAHALASCDIAVFNADEYATATAMLGPDLVGDRNLVVTRGGAGVDLRLRGGVVRHVPALPIAPLDTTGAGDCFVGVLAVSLAEGADLPVAVTRANRAAALACLVRGAQDGLPVAVAIDS